MASLIRRERPATSANTSTCFPPGVLAIIVPLLLQKAPKPAWATAGRSTREKGYALEHIQHNIQQG